MVRDRSRDRGERRGAGDLELAPRIASGEVGSGLQHLTDGALTVARLQIHGGYRISQYGGLVPEPDRIQGGGLDAVVGRKTANHDASYAATAECGVELGWHLLAAGRIPQREPRVTVFPVAPLTDARGILAHLKCGVQLGAPRACHTVHGPDAAVLGEMRSRFGMPVLGEHHGAAALQRGADLLVDARHNAVTTIDGEA